MRECQTGDKGVMVSESLKHKTKGVQQYTFQGEQWYCHLSRRLEAFPRLFL